MPEGGRDGINTDVPAGCKGSWGGDGAGAAVRGSGDDDDDDDDDDSTAVCDRAMEGRHIATKPNTHDAKPSAEHAHTWALLTGLVWVI